MDELVFYHGGAEPDFTLEQLDVLRPSQKQQNQNGSYAGFYMYSEKDRDGAFHYSEQENGLKKTTTKGVEKIVLDSNLKIYEMPPFSITRITQEQIKELQSQGYDLIAGKMMGKTEYVLINKEKVKSMEFLPMSKRYDYKLYAPEYKTRIIEEYRDSYEEQYESQVNTLKSLDEMFVYYDSVKNRLTFDIIDRIYKSVNANINRYPSLMPELYKKKVEEINNSYKPFYEQHLVDEQKRAVEIEKERQQQLQQIQEEQIRKEQERRASEKHIQEVKNKEAKKAMEVLNDLREQYINLFPENKRTLDYIRDMQRVYVSAYYRGDNISSQQLDHMYEAIDRIEQMIEDKKQSNIEIEKNKPQIRQDISIQDTLGLNKENEEQIEKLKQQINDMNNNIKQYIEFMKPYMVIPKVNAEISKVIEKNNEIDSSEIIDSLTDYQRVVEIKQSLVSYLENANKVIKAGIEKEQNKIQVEETQQNSQQVIDDDFWKEFDEPQGKQEVQAGSEEFWSDFMKSGEKYQRFPVNKMLDSNGLYTMEYIAYTMEENEVAAQQMLETNERRMQEMNSQENNIGRAHK